MARQAGSAAGGPRRTLILLRHAKSAWPEGVADDRRPLAGRGRRDAPAAGRWLGAAGYLPGLVLCSTAQRTRETWQLASAALAEAGAQSAPEVRFEQRVYAASAGELLDLIREQPAQVRSLLLVGHEPAMSGLSLLLTGSGPGPAGGARQGAGPGAEHDASGLARLREKFPTAAVAVLSVPAAWSRLRPGGARLAAFVTPREIRAGGAGQEP